MVKRRIINQYCRAVREIDCSRMALANTEPTKSELGEKKSVHWNKHRLSINQSLCI